MIAGSSLTMRLPRIRLAMTWWVSLFIKVYIYPWVDYQADRLQASSLWRGQFDCVKESVDDNWIELSASTTLNFGYNFHDGHC
jgi:hypothetical protein